jgi:hypothetical protein
MGAALLNHDATMAPSPKVAALLFIPLLLLFPAGAQRGEAGTDSFDLDLLDAVPTTPLLLPPSHAPA